METLTINTVHCGDSASLMEQIVPNSIALSFWSPPYFLGKDYEKGATYDSWQDLLKNIISLHFNVLKPGGFLVINIADIISFKNENMPRIMGLNPANRKCNVTKDMILKVMSDFPNYNRQQIAAVFNCSEQTIDRRLNGNNIRGGKYEAGTHVKLVGGNIEQYAYEAGLFLYDKRIWKKDPAWANCKWTTNTLKSVSETEDLYVFWKPGEYIVNRERLTPIEWREWGHRQIWEIPSVRANKEHPAMFPKELASRVIRLFTDEGDIVLDPFLGSGTTAVAAIETNRNFIGIELMKKYAEIATRNIKNAQSSPSLFSIKNADYTGNDDIEDLTGNFVPTKSEQERTVASIVAKANYNVYEEKISTNKSYGTQHRL
ncbi:MAG: site-specific DNA-methyltransferase [Bacteroidales bacterium]|jgi:site-specific DNA-methyltransferase (adenine-specific)|nr:site-specific DNA-methyltransferase [Bacteroidales bacterium]